MTKFVHHKFLHEVFEDIGNSENRAEAVEKLNAYNVKLSPRDAMGMRDVIKGALDPKVIWRLPTNRPPFRACEEHNAPSNVFRETVKFRYLVEGTRESMPQANKRERMFVGMLESVHPKDAEILVAMIQKQTPVGGFKHLTETTVRQAFGDTFFEEDRIKASQDAKVKAEAA